MTIHQTGPTEALAILKRLVASLAYKPGWKFMILDMDRGQGCAGTTLAITTTQPDSWDHTKTVPLWHSMPVRSSTSATSTGRSTQAKPSSTSAAITEHGPSPHSKPAPTSTPSTPATTPSPRSRPTHKASTSTSPPPTPASASPTRPICRRRSRTSARP